jgi:hypothetical protein
VTSVLRRHGALVALVLAAAALRALALVAIYPGIWFSDSNDYVREAATGTLSVVRPGGYALFVAPFWRLGSAGALIVVQHLLGLAIVVAVYALLVRRGVRPWLACLAVVPAALDAYLLDIEHMIMSETVFHAALVGVLLLLLWRERPGPVAAAGAGLALGYAAVVRSVAMPFVAVIAIYLVARRAGWRPVALFVAGWAVVAGGYAALYASQHGHLGFSDYDGRFLYGQVAPFADCAKLPGLPAAERPLCPDPRHRLARNSYVWSPSSPVRRVPQDARVRDFAVRAIRAQPLAYAGVVAGNFVHYLEPGHHTGRDDYSETAWQFPRDPNHWTYPRYRGPIRAGRAHRLRAHDPNAYVSAMVSRPRTDPAASALLHGYQTVFYSSGQVLTPCLLIVLAALLLRRGSARVRADAALLAALAVTSLLVASALSLFDYRYELTAVILLPPAAALAVVAFRPRCRNCASPTASPRR